MDVYDYLKYNKLIKTESEVFNEIKKKNINKTLSKYKFNVIKLDDSENNEDNDILVETDLDIFNKNKNNRILELTDDSQNDNFNYINYIYNLYPKQLDTYTYIDDNIDELLLGGYIRLVTYDNKIKFGGILLKIYNKENIYKMKLLLKNIFNKLVYINFRDYFIFYKKHKTINDKFRNLFIKVAMIE